jgi:hypothetical protein
MIQAREAGFPCRASLLPPKEQARRPVTPLTGRFSFAPKTGSISMHNDERDS